ncbi:MAG: DNA-processing protein DprA [Oscillospiraceae bacterium]|nr:DNA-processing protein DprA [Oscillospiraceae bacterium]
MNEEKQTREQELVYLLWLVMAMGPGNVKSLELLQANGSCRELYYVLHDPDCGLLRAEERRRVTRTTLAQAQGVLAFCEKNGIGIMTWDSTLYPSCLRHIYNPPLVLFYKGDPTLLHRDLILTVVGTRRPSDYSRRIADWLCRDLAHCNMLLASGCAMGLDSAAHGAALAQGKPTIGVLGCGVDYNYPKENRAMREEIASKGLLLSEYFPGTPPYPHNFPTRNRILSGISEGVLVIEAGARSGALITANLACEQGKHVFCVPPGDLLDPRYSGVNGFLRDGAEPVFSYLDILRAYYLEYPHKLSLFDDEHRSRTLDSLVYSEEEEREAPPKRPARSRVKAQVIPAEKPEKAAAIPEEADAVQRRILELLRGGAQNVNAVCHLLELDFETVSMQMLDMEMRGWIVNAQRDMYMLPGEDSE